MDWKTRETSPFPGSQDFVPGAWSPDALHNAVSTGPQIQVFDTRTQRSKQLASGKGLTQPLWSHDGKFIYYQDSMEVEGPIYRANIATGKIEQLATSRQIPQSDLTVYLIAGLAPDDTPIASVVRKNSDIYALELDVP